MPVLTIEPIRDMKIGPCRKVWSLSDVVSWDLMLSCPVFHKCGAVMPKGFFTNALALGSRILYSVSVS